MTSNMDLRALDYIDPGQLPYEEWVYVGMALKNSGFDFSTWDSWSSRDPEGYQKAGESQGLERKWEGFDTSGGRGWGTIVHYAQGNGYVPKGDYPLGWEDPTNTDPRPFKKPFKSSYKADTSGTIPEPQKDHDTSVWTQIEPPQAPQMPEMIHKLPLTGVGEDTDQTKAFIEALYNPEEHLNIVTRCSNPDADKPKPIQKANPTMTAERVLQALNQLGPRDTLQMAIGAYAPQAGVWIGLNPIDGAGTAGKNVTRFDYLLIEMDSIPAYTDQWEALVSSHLPIKAVYYSGGQSLHACVDVSAKDVSQYRARTKRIYEWFRERGIEIDQANKNVNRLTRLPGAVRGDRQQTLITLEPMGFNTYEEWEAWTQAPEPVELPEMVTADQIEDEKLLFLIDKAIPMHGITVLGAVGGSGKSTIICQTIAGLIRGQPTIFDYESGAPWTPREPKKVMLFASEDTMGVTYTPLIRQMGCTDEDMKRLVTLPAESPAFPSIKYNSPVLWGLIKKHKPDLIVFDPLQAFLPNNVKMSERNQMRNTLQEMLSNIGKNTPVMIVAHCNKNLNFSGVDRIADSKDITDLARSVYLIGTTGEKNEDGEPVRYLSHEKSNGFPMRSTILYEFQTVQTSVGGRGMVVPRGITKDKDSDFTAKKRFKEKDKGESKLESAKSFIEFCISGLKEGDAMDRSQIIEDAQTYGISEHTCRRALAELNKSRKIKSYTVGKGEDRKTMITLFPDMTGKKPESQESD